MAKEDGEEGGVAESFISRENQLEDGAHPSVCIRSLEAGRITEAEGHAYEAYIKRGHELESEIETLKASFLAAMAERQQWIGRLMVIDDEPTDTTARAALDRKRARAPEECEHDFMRRAPSYMRDNGEFEYVCEKCGCRDCLGS